MKIDDYMKNRILPRLGRVVKVEMDVLRNGLGSNGGVIFDIDAVVIRKVRRVMDADGWRWQLVRDHLEQNEWDYFFSQDKDSLDEINYKYGLIK